MTVSPMRTTIAHLTGEQTITWTVSVTRGEAMEYLIDAGADEDEVADMSDADLLAGMLDADSDFSDEVRDRLADIASEEDSSEIKWEVDQ